MDAPIASPGGYARRKAFPSDGAAITNPQRFGSDSQRQISFRSACRRSVSSRGPYEPSLTPETLRWSRCALSYQARTTQ